MPAELFIGSNVDDNSELSRLSASMSDGYCTMSRRIYYKNATDASEIFSHETFPKVYAAHPRNAQYKFTGNAQVSPLSEKSKIWYADLEYSNDTRSKGSGTLSGNPITEDTEPWDLLPEQISFTYPEIMVPFTHGYNDKGEAVIPVANSAGDPFIAEKPEKTIDISFTFAVKDWDLSNTFDFCNSINSTSVTICSFPIQVKSALLYKLEPTYMTVYDDDGEVKWQYWQINVAIKVDPKNVLLQRKFLDTGDRAKFDEIDLSDDAVLKKAKSLGSVAVPTSFAATKMASQICHFRKFTYNNGYVQNGDLVFCGWEQYIDIRRAYLTASKIIKEKVKSGSESLNSVIDLQCEQDTQMPLYEGSLDTTAIKGHPDYDPEIDYIVNLTFDSYKPMDWTVLSLPEKAY